MRLEHILVFSVLALASVYAAGGRWRSTIILIASTAAVFWLQPISPIRGLDFWLPLTSIGLTIIVWLVVQRGQFRGDTWTTLALLIGVVALLAVTRYVDFACCLTATRPPPIGLVAGGVVIIGVAALVVFFLPVQTGARAILLMLFLFGLLFVLKSSPIAEVASRGIRSLTGQSVGQAASSDIVWLGYSYIFFRLMTALIEVRKGKLPAFSASEFVNYILFFPTLTAGPIDTAKRFLKDYQESESAAELENLYEGGRRIAIGLFKKFVVADTLALIALNDMNAIQVNSTGWTWVLLYAYAFRLFFDFAGYSDIAIGIARLMGIRVPENFDSPYLKPNITMFWNSWHITLANWLRSYYFNPVSKGLRTRLKTVPVSVLIAFSQITTMILVGVWHGLTWNFFIWGAWHGVGLFIHNRWMSVMRVRLNRLREIPRMNLLINTAGVLVTFHYVVIGWAWFALSETATSWRVLQSLFGVAS